MNYDQYVKYQTEGPGMIKKPLKYRRGERRAIDWFFQGVPKDQYILDVGCGTGVGMKHLNSLGFLRTTGIELNEKKFFICRRKQLDVHNLDIEKNQFTLNYFDLVWASHSFEHMLHPSVVLERL